MTGCIEEPTVQRKEMSIAARQPGTDFIYAGLPINFVVSPENNFWNESLSASWTFGDGTTATGLSLYHTYFFPGQYHTTLFTESPQSSADTMLRVLPERNRVGQRNASENGKLISEDPTSGYRIVHTWNKNSSADDWKFLAVTSLFDSIKTNGLPFETYADVHKMFINSDGNLVAMEEFLWEIDKSGGVINKSNSYTDLLLDIIETETGYLGAGYKFSDKLLTLVEFDRSFKIISEDQLDINEDGFLPTSFILEPGERIRLIYYEQSDAEQRARKMVLRQLDGTRLVERNFGVDEPVSQAIPLPSGTFLHGARYVEYSGPAEYIFVKTDDAGNKRWSFRFSIGQPYFGYIHDARIEALEAGDFTYIFFDAMRVAKISSAGELLWVKQYGITDDTFNSAIRNSRGNFVMLGAQQFDYDGNNYTTEYSKRDLVFIEIDLEGNVITE